MVSPHGFPRPGRCQSNQWANLGCHSKGVDLFETIGKFQSFFFCPYFPLTPHREATPPNTTKGNPERSWATHPQRMK